MDKEQPADQRELTWVVIADNSDAPLPVIEWYGVHLDKVLIVETFCESGV